MEPKSAAEHLQVIRTLMERTALYRRALAPIMILVGSLGVLAALIGWRLQLWRPEVFIPYWYGVGALGLAGAFLMVRFQAWQQSEPFWSPPTRRVAESMLPPLIAGFVLGLIVMAASHVEGREDPYDVLEPSWPVLVGLPLAWVILYGCAIHASGFFMTRGMRLFGWVLILGGCAGFVVNQPAHLLGYGYGVMGFFFGLLHLAYGGYLYFTERRPQTS